MRILAVATVAASLFFPACSRVSSNASSDARNAQAGAAAGRGSGGGVGRGGGAAVPVATATVVQRALPVMVRAVGNVESSSSVDVRSQVTGTLLTVAFREGQPVKQGELLFTIDPRPFDLAVRQAEAQLAKDAGQSKTAEMQRTRYADLLARGLIAQSEMDTVAAQANSLQSTLALDRVQIENARLQLQYTQIRAPITGRTGALLVHPGSLVRANDTTPLVVVNRTSPVYVSFALPARTLPSLRTPRTLQVQASAAGSPDTPSLGSVTFVDNAVDPATDTIRVKATFPNTDQHLWPGQFVEVNLRLSVDEHAIVVPSAAVQPGQDGSFVWVVNKNQTADVRPVTVTRSEGADAVVGTGLAAGDVVVTDGQLRLTPGVRITVKPLESREAS